MNKKSTKSSKLLTPTRLSGDSTNSSPAGTSKLKKLTSGKVGGIATAKNKALKKKPVQKAIAENQVLAVLKNGLTMRICNGVCSGRQKCEGNCGTKKVEKKPAKGKIGTSSPRKASKADQNNNVKRSRTPSKGAIPKQPKATKAPPLVNFGEIEAEFLSYKSNEAANKAVKTIKEEKPTPKRAVSKKVKTGVEDVSAPSQAIDEQSDQPVISQEEEDQTTPDSPEKVLRGGDDADSTSSDSFETEEEHEIDEEIEREGLEELAAIQDKLLDNSKEKPKKEKIKLPDIKDEKKLDKSLKKVVKAMGKLSKYVDKYLNEDEYEGDESETSSESESLATSYCSCSEFDEDSSDSYDCFHESSSGEDQKEDGVVPRLKIVRQQSFKVVNF